MSAARADWTLIGCHPVAEGVHRIPLPMPQDGLRAINVYVVTGPDGVSLIDAGWNVSGNLEILTEGLRSIDVGLDVARGLPWTRRERTFATLDGFNQMIATCETVAHLDVLVARGALRVDSVFGDGVERYALFR